MFVIRTIRIQASRASLETRQSTTHQSHIAGSAFLRQQRCRKERHWPSIHHNGTTSLRSPIAPWTTLAMVAITTGLQRRLVERSFRNAQASPGLQFGPGRRRRVREAETASSRADRVVAHLGEIDAQTTQRAGLEASSLTVAQEATWKAHKDTAMDPYPFLNGMGKSKARSSRRSGRCRCPKATWPVALDSCTSHEGCGLVRAAKVKGELDIGGIRWRRSSLPLDRMHCRVIDSPARAFDQSLGNMTGWRGAKHIHDEQCPFCSKACPAISRTISTS